MVGGELVTRSRRRPARRLHPRRLRALRAAPPARRRAGRLDRPADASPPPAARSAAHARASWQGVTVEQALAPPDVGDGRQDHDRLGDADEQGPRADRGPPPLRHAVRPDRRRRAPAVDRPRARLAVRRRDARAPRAMPDMRVAIAYALHHPERVDLPIPPLDLAEVGSLTFEPPDEDGVPVPAAGARGGAWPAAPAPCVLNAANEVAVHAFLSGRLTFLGIAGGDRGGARAARRRARARLRDALRRPTPRPARWPASWSSGAGGMSWLLAFLGFAVADHPARAGPLRGGQGRRHARRALLAVLPAAARAQVRRGETEYAIGAIPLGGYVKITGMNPHEEIPPEVAHRAYFRQPVWKRIVVILAGPGGEHRARLPAAVGALLVQRHRASRRPTSSAIEPDYPAAGALQPGDELVAVDGVRGEQEALPSRSRSHKCAGSPAAGCSRRATPAVRRRRATARSSRCGCAPIYDAGAERTRIGFGFGSDPVERVGPGRGGRARRSTRCGRHQRHRRDDRRHLRGREARGDLRRRRLLRGDAPGVRVRAPNRAATCWPSSRSRSASSTCSRSCRSTAATSSGRWRRRCAARRSPSRHGARRLRRLRARDRAVRHRVDERHRPAHRRRVRRSVVSPRWTRSRALSAGTGARASRTGSRSAPRTTRSR